MSDTLYGEGTEGLGAEEHHDLLDFYSTHTYRELAVCQALF